MESVYLTGFLWLVLIGLVFVIALPLAAVYFAVNGKSNIKPSKMPNINRI